MGSETSLNPRQDLFCTFVAEGMPYAVAARMAGYAPKTSRERGSELMATDAVRRRVEALRARRTADQAAAFDRVVGHLDRLIDRAFEQDQLMVAYRAIALLARVDPLKNRANARLPAFADAPEVDDDLAGLLLGLAGPEPESGPAPAPAAPASLNRRQRRALKVALRRE